MYDVTGPCLNPNAPQERLPSIPKSEDWSLERAAGSRIREELSPVLAPVA